MYLEKMNFCPQMSRTGLTVAPMIAIQPVRQKTINPFICIVYQHRNRKCIGVFVNICCYYYSGDGLTTNLVHTAKQEILLCKEMKKKSKFNRHTSERSYCGRKNAYRKKGKGS